MESVNQLELVTHLEPATHKEFVTLKKPDVLEASIAPKELVLHFCTLRGHHVSHSCLFEKEMFGNPSAQDQLYDHFGAPRIT